MEDVQQTTSVDAPVALSVDEAADAILSRWEDKDAETQPSEDPETIETPDVEQEETTDIEETDEAEETDSPDEDEIEQDDEDANETEDDDEADDEEAEGVEAPRPKQFGPKSCSMQGRRARVTWLQRFEELRQCKMKRGHTCSDVSQWSSSDSKHVCVYKMMSLCHSRADRCACCVCLRADGARDLAG